MPELRELSCFRLPVPSPGGPYALSGGRRYEGFTSTVVRLEASDGTVGWGEASTMGSDYLDGFLGSTEAAVAELAPVVLAADPLQALPLVQAMDRAVLGHRPAKAAIDIAMWDLRARLLGVPVGVLLGGVEQTTLEAFDAVRVASTPAAVAEARELVGHGYRRLQVKVGDDPVEDARRVRAVAEAVGGELTSLTCDANRGWRPVEALRFARLVSDLDILLEQPCSSLAELAQVAARCDVPLILDEGAKELRDLLDAVALGCVAGVNVKPVRLGGLTSAARLRDIASAAGLLMTVDEPMGSSLATAGAVQLAATVDPRLLAGVSFFGRRDASAPTGPSFVDGHVRVPVGPGLGVIPDAEALGEPVFTHTTTQGA